MFRACDGNSRVIRSGCVVCDRNSDGSDSVNPLFVFDRIPLTDCIDLLEEGLDIRNRILSRCFVLGQEEVAAILENGYPGQVHGDAIALLYGDVDAGGRLPMTFALEEAYPFTAERNFPGVDGKVHYSEGVFVGYRYFDATETEPTYPFGHGHSYADFEYVDAELNGDTVSVAVENTAERDDREIIQVYVRSLEANGVTRPERELAGFESVPVSTGDTETVEITLDERAFQRYDEAMGWTTDAGEYTLEVAHSSRDVRAELISVR